VKAARLALSEADRSDIGDELIDMHLGTARLATMALGPLSRYAIYLK